MYNKLKIQCSDDSANSTFEDQMIGLNVMNQKHVQLKIFSDDFSNMMYYEQRYQR